MRYNIHKKNSTKTERIVYEVLKELKIPFKHRWIIQGREVDFVIGNLCIEINGHEQDVEKNHLLAGLGYKPIHFSNTEILTDIEQVKRQIIWHSQQDTQRY